MKLTINQLRKIISEEVARATGRRSRRLSEAAAQTFHYVRKGWDRNGNNGPTADDSWIHVTASSMEDAVSKLPPVEQRFVTQYLEKKGMGIEELSDGMFWGVPFSISDDDNYQAILEEG